jgi:uncharacterized membrane protein YvlD (DUF360 family)
MVYSAWLGPYGWSIFFFGLVAAIILFAIRRKFYPVMYLVSIALYIFTIGFVLLLLAFSAVVFILLGLDFSRKHDKRKSRFASSIPRKK